MFYSPELRKLLTACMAPDPRNRPETYHLFREAKRHAEEWGIRAQREGEEAFRRGASGCFHSKVLYTKKHQNRYESDPVFRAGYRKANLRPLYRHLERQPAPPVPPVVPPPPEPPGAADYEHIDVAEMPPKPVRREQQQRGGIRPEMERKIAKKSKEDRKKKGRRMGFLRTALSRFGFA